jgi:hypothetical protein
VTTPPSRTLPLPPQEPTPARSGRRRARRRPADPVQPRRSARRRSTLLIALAIVIPQLTLALVLAVGLDLIPHRGALSAAKDRAAAADAKLGTGNCVSADTVRPQFYVKVACDDSRVTGRVIGVVTGPAPATESCAEDTDFFATRPGQVVCLRRTGGATA